MKRIEDLTNDELMMYFNHKTFDTKMASQILRLLDQLNQIINNGTIDLMNNKEEAKSMREGTWGTWNEFEKYVLDMIKILEKKSMTQKVIPSKPIMVKLKKLLADCIEEWYGSESKMQVQTKEYVSVQELWDRLDRIESKL
jgi:hypothetical protein